MSRLFSLGILLLLALTTPLFLFAATEAELRNQISATEARIKALEAEITQYQKALDDVSGKKKTLQGAISELDLSRKKISTDISATEAKITSASLTIEELSGSIGVIERTILSQRGAIARSIRDINVRDEQHIVEYLLGEETFSDAMVRTDEYVQFQEALKDHIKNLEGNQQDLTEHKSSVETTKKSLDDLKRALASKKQALDVARQEQASLLKQTQNKESEYQKLLTTKQTAHEQFESDLNALEAQLKTVIDPSSIPHVGSGTLKWPFGGDFMNACGSRKSALGNVFCITQYFGNTPFSTANPQIYNGAGHNGVDFGAPTGTPLEAALLGTVKGTGNTDEVKGCYSYGKWVLIEHGNGLTTLYSHLSRINVSAGQKVSTGEVIGYSGNTGYSTGPHLHFTVFATQGVEIIRLGDIRARTNCANARIPVSPVNGYLNPLSYL
jgi:murein DD-endopeptidase MepM/ murein hydrolase activator NlpD